MRNLCFQNEKSFRKIAFRFSSPCSEIHFVQVYLHFESNVSGLELKVEPNTVWKLNHHLSRYIFVPRLQTFRLSALFKCHSVIDFNIKLFAVFLDNFLSLLNANKMRPRHQAKCGETKPFIEKCRCLLGCFLLFVVIVIQKNCFLSLGIRVIPKF